MNLPNPDLYKYIVNGLCDVTNTYILKSNFLCPINNGFIMYLWTIYGYGWLETYDQSLI